MGEVIYGDIKQYIEELAQSLGVAAGHVYELLVRQQVISGIITVLAVLGAIFIFGVIIFLTTKMVARQERRYSPTLVEVVQVFSVIAGAVTILVGVTVVPSAINHIFNPEYYAIKEIMDVFKGGR